jgi:hypothetical protein
MSLLKTFIIFALSLWSIYQTYGIWNVTNAYELLISLIIVIFPAAFALFFISYIGKSKDKGIIKIIDILGICISTAALSITLLFFLKDFFVHLQN